MPGEFHGVGFGTSREAAIARLSAYARALGEEVEVITRGDEVTAGGSVYLTGAEWTIGFSFDDYDTVCSHVGMWRRRPAGREASVAWVAERVAAYGRPGCVALLAPSDARPVSAQLEWSTATTCTSVSLQSDAGAWDVREDLLAYALPRDGLEALGEHRAQLARLRERLAGQPARAGSVGELLARMAGWARERDEVLARLAPLVPGVGVLDVAAAVAQAGRTLDALAGGVPDSDGAYLVMRTPVEPQTGEVRQRLWGLVHAAGLRSEQLTWWPGFTVEPTTREPLPPPPDEQVDWVEGPLAARLLRTELLPAVPRGAGCEVVPASFVVVEGAVAEWLRVPPAAASPWSRKYALSTTMLRPLRLRHPPSGAGVYLNHGVTADDVLRHAHALLAARVAGRRRS